MRNILKANLFARDLAFCLALSDARKRENAQARCEAQSNRELCVMLLAEAKRRGQSEIDWVEYFRNAGIQ